MTPARLITFAVNELVIDAEAVAEAILRACRRGSAACVQGVIQLRSEFIVILADAPQSPQDLRFHQIDNPSLPDLESAMESRWIGGYDALGMITDDSPEATRCFILVQKR